MALENCIIKRKATSEEFELHVNNKSSIINSPKKFKLSEDVEREKETECAKVKSLEEVKDVWSTSKFHL